MKALKFYFLLRCLSVAWSASADSFSVSAWTNDASAQVDANATCCAYSFGSSNSAEINGVTFTGIGGGNPAVDGVFSVSGIGKTHEDLVHNLTDDGSSALANHFIWKGKPGSLTLKGLTVDVEYTLVMYSVAFDAAGERFITFSDGTISEKIDQDLYGDNEGICITYAFTADSDSRTLTMTAQNEANTFHFHGFALSSTAHYVSPQGTAVSPYTTWRTAATNIQDAVDVAASGDSVFVTNGTYAAGGMIPPSSSAPYTLVNRVCLTRAITVKSVNGPAETVIDAGGVMRGVYLSGGALLSGFTITNGVTTTISGYTEDRDGGGILIGNSGIVSNCFIFGCNASCGGGIKSRTTGQIIDCTISGNTANYGGGCHSCILLNCTLSGNTAKKDGGGCNRSTLTGCTLSDNKAQDGGGSRECTLINCTLTSNSAHLGGGSFQDNLTNCIVSSNSATFFGGGCYESTLTECTLLKNSAVESGGGSYGSSITDCTLTGNTADYSGGGSYSDTLTHCVLSTNVATKKGGGSYRSRLERCTLSDNSAPLGAGSYEDSLNACTLSGNTANFGGGSYSSILTNCILSSNTATYGGGSYEGTLTHCTLVDNSVSGKGGGCCYGSLTNCIIWNNTADLGNPNWYAFTPELSVCCTTPLPDGTGNITHNPCFTGVDAGDYSLACTSPCIDAGTNTVSETDMDGNPRCVDGDFNGIAVADMGAYEYQPDQTDSDGDSFSDYAEYVAATSMTNANDYFCVDINGCTLCLTTAAGRDYTVQVCTNLVGGIWNTCTNITGTSTEELLNAVTSDQKEAFYRVQVKLSK